MAILLFFLRWCVSLSRSVMYNIHTLRSNPQLLVYTDGDDDTRYCRIVYFRYVYVCIDIYVIKYALEKGVRRARWDCTGTTGSLSLARREIWSVALLCTLPLSLSLSLTRLLVAPCHTPRRVSLVTALLFLNILIYFFYISIYSCAFSYAYMYIYRYTLVSKI